jgi:hypothetical protein
MRQRADWLAWSLQFIFGLIVGTFFGFGIIAKSHRRGGGWWLASEQVSIFLSGAALIGAGLASYYGDRLWLGSSYRVIPPDDMKQSRISRIISIVTGTLG